MKRYLDTSLLVSSLTNEAATTRSQAWFANQPLESFWISDWVTTEVSSALSLKIRRGELDIAGRARALTMFSRLRSSSFTILAVTAANFLSAATLSDRHETGIRAADALHLAICADHNATLCTLDRPLAKAGPLIGVPTLLV